ncbi:minichromosome maintenance protein MCM [Halobacteriaceae bacterium SHR40]|uniref:AAA family ATPase n=1 Tax=Halovenus amylolytica TaxID=2500550 RepID=UPI000FE352CD
MATPFDKVMDKTERIIEYIQNCQESDMEAIARGDTNKFSVDCGDVEHYDAALWHFMKHNPGSGGWEMWWKEAVRCYVENCEEFESDDDWDIDEVDWPDDWEGTPDNSDDIDVTLVNVPDSVLMDIGEPRTDRLGEIVKIRGVVRQLSSPKTKTKQAIFECQRCGTTHRVPVRGDKVQSPYECEKCEKKGPWRRMTDTEKYVDYQELHVQEEPGEATDTSNPREMTVKIEGTDLTDSAVPGDRVEVTGNLKKELEDDNAVLIDSSMEAQSIESEDHDFESMELTDEEIQEFEELSERDDLLEVLTKTLAPDIYGYELPKKALLYQLFGGVTRFKDEPNREIKSGEIHQAWVGDPGSGKSKLAAQGRRVAPRSVKSVGKGASEAGMTVAAVRKEIAGSTEWTLEAGALVLADKGFITIDELDKMGEEVQASLNEALADREVSIDKAGISTTLRTRPSALMIANPVYSRFDPYEALIDQFGLEDSLLDRADMVITFQDIPDAEADAAIADSMLEGCCVDSQSEGAVVADGSIVGDDGMLAVETMQKYIAYARREYRPDLSEDAYERIKDFYLTIRDLSDDDTVAVSARALGALRRFSEARARMRLSDVVSVEDAAAVIEMFMESYKELGIDPDSGKFDADRYAGRSGSSDREYQRELIVEKTKELGARDSGAPEEEVIEEIVEEHDYDEATIGHVIHNMLKQGDLYNPEKDELRVNGGSR